MAKFSMTGGMFYDLERKILASVTWYRGAIMFCQPLQEDMLYMMMYDTLGPIIELCNDVRKYNGLSEIDYFDQFYTVPDTE